VPDEEELEEYLAELEDEIAAVRRDLQSARRERPTRAAGTSTTNG
jgi:hypothetical protein